MKGYYGNMKEYDRNMKENEGILRSLKENEGLMPPPGVGCMDRRSTYRSLNKIRGIQ